MSKRLALLSTGLVAAALLAGCGTIREEQTHIKNRTENVTNVVGNIWRIEASWPGTKLATKLTEHLHTRAQQFCGKRGMGMLPLSGASSDGSGDEAKPAEGWLEFRCQQGVKVESTYDGIHAHIDAEDLDEGFSF